MSTAEPRISVFLPSHNKRGFAVEAVKSVFAQDFTDWELWILENSTDSKTRNLLSKFTDLSDPRVRYVEVDLTPEIRRAHWPAPYLLNQYYPKANGEIIMYISDDDLWVPGIFRHVVNHFDANPDHEAVYFDFARTRAPQPGTGTRWDESFMFIEANEPRGSGQVDCQIDGGQVAYKKQVLDRISQPWFYDSTESPGDAAHCDGLHLEKICREADVTFYPILQPGVIHRHTLLSVWTQ